MRIVIISQVFWPDTASTAQHLFDFAEILIKAGHDVTVYSSRYAYENTQIKYPARETFNLIKIERLGNTGFGKKWIAGRIVDFASFNLLLFLKLIFLKGKKIDLMIGMTSPPLVSYLGIIAASWKGKKFLYWGMDLQPELSIASGLIRKGSVISKLLSFAGNTIIRKADSIVALDRYMKTYFVKRGAQADKIHIIPVWPVMKATYEGGRLDNPFRIGNNFKDKIVIMYSGNHSYVHPLNTLLETALLLKEDMDFLYVFIGGGVRKKDVSEFKEKYQLNNMLQLPYQPRDQIHLSLGASDLQVVIMGDGQVGFTHPNKIYGAMFMSKPILYIGPSPSHVTDILKAIEGNIMANHGESKEIVQQLLLFKKLSQAQRDIIGNTNKAFAFDHFHPDKLKTKMAEVVDILAEETRDTMKDE